ncbi:MAG: hypothetical protein M3Y08_18190, partial [Fibrobacterota bacterium]|nr:hypothetical protein [Fibrobacterota bacterium]
FKADTDRMKAQEDMKVKQGAMLLKADDQKHDQVIENAKLVQDAHSHTHSRDQDEKKFGMAGQKMSLDNAFRDSQSGNGPTGANPGKKPSSRAET